MRESREALLVLSRLTAVVLEPATRLPPPRSAGRGRPPQAAARRAGLEFVEKLLTTNLTSTDTTERNAGMLRVPPCRIAG
jgi:hypothetical protein